MKKEYSYLVNSLSFGVLAIARDEFAKEDVKYFITGTAFPVEDDGMPNMKEILEAYGDSYWSTQKGEDIHEKCVEVLKYLIIEKKIVQPRIILSKETSPCIFVDNAPLIGHSRKNFFETVEEWAGVDPEKTAEEQSDAVKHNLWLIERLRAHGYEI